MLLTKALSMMDSTADRPSETQINSYPERQTLKDPGMIKRIEELKMKRFDYYKTACCSPEVEIADPQSNARRILDLCSRLSEDTQLALFPELCISGYTCQDLFYESSLQKGCLEALEEISKGINENLALIVGLPLRVDNRLYNAAAFIYGNRVLGFSVKTYLPNYNEYYESRWFASAATLEPGSTILFDHRQVPVGNDLIYVDETTQAQIGIEICEDLWAGIPVSSLLSAAGANILCNASASNEIIGKDTFRDELVIQQSARQYCAYLYASAGPKESSSDLIFSGADLIAENGQLLASTTMTDGKHLIEAEIDLQHLITDRLHHLDIFAAPVRPFRKISYASKTIEEISLQRTIPAYPFVPEGEDRISRCKQIITLQAYGLAVRLEKINCKNVVLGLSGGLDSTLALLVCLRAFDLNGLDRKGIHAILMPGFGTTSRTKSNAEMLAELCGVSVQTIRIEKSVLQHFEDISHDQNIHDITYENSQARERTQILMDLANKLGGIVIGTGDLSESALGWCTYNGDHMSMYNVNASIPKTLIRYMIEAQALEAGYEGKEELKKTLLDICDTPVSPELLPPDESGKIAQKTEEILGSYDLHDFFLYHMIRFHEPPAKIYALALKAFPSLGQESILKALKTFYRRFFQSQFKRNASPDGIKVGSVSLSQRGDWRMPSDASASLWLKELEKLD